MVQKREVLKIDKAGNIIARYSGVDEAAEENFMDKWTIRKRCLRQIKREWSYGFSFRFADDPEV